MLLSLVLERAKWPIARQEGVRQDLCTGKEISGMKEGGITKPDTEEAGHVRDEVTSHEPQGSK